MNMANDNLKLLEFANPFLPWVEQGLRMFDQGLTASQDVGEAVDRVMRAEASADLPAAAAQRNVFELMTEAWVQWMSWLGAMAALGTKAALPRDVVRQMSAVHRSAEKVTSAGGERQPRQEHREHALASGEPKHRRSATKTRRARRS
jgi:hypothetical protein